METWPLKALPEVIQDFKSHHSGMETKYRGDHANKHASFKSHHSGMETGIVELEATDGFKL